MPVSQHGPDQSARLALVQLGGEPVPAGALPRWGPLVPGPPAHLLLPMSAGTDATAPRPRLVPGLVTRRGVADADEARFAAGRSLPTDSSAWVVDDAGCLIGHRAPADDTASSGEALRRLSAEELYERMLPAFVLVTPVP